MFKEIKNSRESLRATTETLTPERCEKQHTEDQEQIQKITQNEVEMAPRRPPKTLRGEGGRQNGPKTAFWSVLAMKKGGDRLRVILSRAGADPRTRSRARFLVFKETTT